MNKEKKKGDRMTKMKRSKKPSNVVEGLMERNYRRIREKVEQGEE
jgi:hypothetical protein